MIYIIVSSFTDVDIHLWIYTDTNVQSNHIMYSNHPVFVWWIIFRQVTFCFKRFVHDMCWPNFRCRILLLFAGMKALPFAICLTKRESLVRLELDIDVSLASLVTHMQSQTVVSVSARCMTAWESWIAWHMTCWKLRWNLCWVSPVPVEWQPTRSLQSSRAQRPVLHCRWWRIVEVTCITVIFVLWADAVTGHFDIRLGCGLHKPNQQALNTCHCNCTFPKPRRKKGKFGFLQCVLSHILGIAIGQKHNHSWLNLSRRWWDIIRTICECNRIITTSSQCVFIAFPPFVFMRHHGDPGKWGITT